jgi:cyclase
MKTNVERTLTDLGDGLFAYVQADGSWGWSNSGLIVSEGRSLLVDTLFTGALTRDMLETYRASIPEARQIDILVNTHANGDHTFGNYLVEGARIVASKACADEMEERTAPEFAAMMSGWRDFGATGRFLHETMGVTFDFSDIRHTPPTEQFTGATSLTLGDRRIELQEFGPAHTKGDIVIHLPDAKTVFTGDLLFAGSHPILWAGPIENWITACDTMLSWGVETVVPGHGPISGPEALRDMRDYLKSILDGSKARYEAGLGWEEAAFDLAREMTDTWIERERIIANVANVYRDLSGGTLQPDREEIFRHMLRFRNGADCPHDTGTCGCGAGGRG